jgi:hypothetical protein
VWLEDFVSHLKDLESGVVHPVFDVALRSKALSTTKWAERAHVAGTTEIFHAAGMKYGPAARHAILFCQGGRTKLMTDLREYSEGDALSWCAEFKKGRVKNRDAAEIYKNYREQVQSCSPKEIERVAREMIELGIPSHQNPKT